MNFEIVDRTHMTSPLLHHSDRTTGSKDNAMTIITNYQPRERVVRHGFSGSAAAAAVSPTSLRLAEGSHQPGSGKACAMNAICYLNGDTEISDFPARSARPLAAFVNWCNDVLAGPDGYLSPEDSLLALELAWQTVGTASVSEAVIHAWVAELLTNPTWGVVRYADNEAVDAISEIAELHRKAASGDMATIVTWYVAECAARAAARATDPTRNAAALYAIRAAHQSTAPLDTDHGRALDAVTGNAVRAHQLATEGAAPYRAIELARQAIGAWRDLAGLDNPGDVNLASVKKLEQRMRAA